MDGSPFDDLLRSLSESRRSFLTGALAVVAGLLVVPGVDARKNRRRKKRKKKAKPNAFGCLEVGDACKNDGQCCSGICEGKKCRAHGAGTCKQEAEGFCTSPDPELTTCDNAANCACIRTTAGSNFCANFNAGDCADCNEDADCEALGFLPGSACAPFPDGNYAGPCESGKVCLVPRGVQPLTN